MKSVIQIEFKGRAREHDFEEESISVHSPEELFAFVAPGGGCDEIPDDVEEIQIVFLHEAQHKTVNLIADCQATLELGMVYLTGSLAEINQTIETLINKAGRGELSEGFLRVTGIKT